jgi:hypothetical protein
MLQLRIQLKQTHAIGNSSNRIPLAWNTLVLNLFPKLESELRVEVYDTPVVSVQFDP